MSATPDLPSPRDPRGRGFRDRADVGAVIALLESRTASLPEETVPILEAYRRVLAVPVVSPVDVPSFRRSSMDGFAVRAEDTYGATEYDPMPLRVVGSVRPGQDTDQAQSTAAAVGSGEAVEIRTGAPVPPGADAVLRVEWTRGRSGSTSEIDAVHPVSPAQDIGEVGEDIRTGTELLARGRTLRPQDIGVMSSIGLEAVSCVKRPRVDVFITGREVLPAGKFASREKSNPHQIIDANGPMLCALVERDTGCAPRLLYLDDDRDGIRDAIANSDADALLISGGSSVGDEDFVPGIITELGELPVHGVALRPASPSGVGFIGSRPVFLAPGNPVSCLCAYDLFAGPTLRSLSGRSRAQPYRAVTRPLSEKLTSVAGRLDYCRVLIDDATITPLSVRGASRLSSTTRADGFVLVPADLEGYSAGVTVTAYEYDIDGRGSGNIRGTKAVDE